MGRRLNTEEATAEINRMLADAGSSRTVAANTVRDWRKARWARGPRFHRVGTAGRYVEYDVDDLATFVRDYLGTATPAQGIPVAAAAR
jgi:hypothetical protein